MPLGHFNNDLATKKKLSRFFLHIIFWDFFYVLPATRIYYVKFLHRLTETLNFFSFFYFFLRCQMCEI